MTQTPALGLSHWQSVSPAGKDAARSRITTAINEDPDGLVATFYNTFMHHDASAAYLSHSVVQERLSGSLRNWLLDMVTVDPLAHSEKFEQQQLLIGAVHARINIPNHLVMAGATLLKTEIGRRIVRICNDPQALGDTLLLLDELIDHAMRIMSTAYESNSRETVKENEAYRYLALAEDMDLERETQRAALMEWSQSVLFALLAEGGGGPQPLAASPFGLWVRHRAKHLFSGADMLKKIDHAIAAIDDQLLPAIRRAQGGPDLSALIPRLKAQVEEIQYLLSTLFQAASTVETGRDPLTRILNRRFLPALLGRELVLAKTNDVPLSVLMVDVDHFKQVNDSFGHSGGDTVLKLVAEMLLDSVRASDFVFRYGGEEFLIVLVETPKERAQLIAERLRQRIEQQQIVLPEHGPVYVSVSVGLAAYEGHPDPKYLIDRADKALYRAKNEGRNRVVTA